MARTLTESLPDIGHFTVPALRAGRPECIPVLLAGTRMEGLPGATSRGDSPASAVFMEEDSVEVASMEAEEEEEEEDFTVAVAGSGSRLDGGEQP